MHAFKHLKSLMCAKPILWQPDYTKAFFLATDAFAYGMGTILSQEGELNPRTQKPMLCPIAYYSSTFTPTEWNYNIYEREFLGVLKALKHFRPHITATEIPVTILTDHTNLTHWKATRKVNRWVGRWFAEIQDYNLIIKHIPGKIHTALNMLSRPPGADHGKEDNTDIVLLPPSMLITTTHTKDDALRWRVKDTTEIESRNGTMVWHSRGQETTRRICQRLETSSTIWTNTTTWTLSTILQLTHSWPPRKRQHHCPHCSTLLVARNEYMGGKICHRVCPLPTEQGAHHKEENPTIPYPRRSLHAAI